MISDLHSEKDMWVQSIKMPAAKDSCQRFYIYRGDLECTIAPGNKQHKLRHHLTNALASGYACAATFGGPHSNHVAAFVSRCVQLSIQPLVVVRGEVCVQLTPMLRHAVNQGASLFPSSREDYRRGLEAEVTHQVDAYGLPVYWVPEGGSGKLGFLGCVEWAATIRQQIDQDAHVCVASGTGTTAAAFAASDFTKVSVFSALKGVPSITDDIALLCSEYGEHVQAELYGYDECRHGGFGKQSPALFQFLKSFSSLNPDVMLDPVYTAKMLFRVNELLSNGEWSSPKTLFIHTGGLQGWQGVKAAQNPYG